MHEVKYVFKLLKEWEKSYDSVNIFIAKQERKIDVYARYPELKELKNALLDGMMILWEYVRLNPQIFDKDHVHDFWERQDKKK